MTQLCGLHLLQGKLTSTPNVRPVTDIAPFSDTARFLDRPIFGCACKLPASRSPALHCCTPDGRHRAAIMAGKRTKADATRRPARRAVRRTSATMPQSTKQPSPSPPPLPRRECGRSWARHPRRARAPARRRETLAAAHAPREETAPKASPAKRTSTDTLPAPPAATDDKSSTVPASLATARDRTMLASPRVPRAPTFRAREEVDS